MISFKAFGGSGPLSQVERIRQGLRDLGNEDGIAVDLVYSNDAGTHEEAIRYRAEKAPQAKLILNVLDIPEHCFPPLGSYGSVELGRLGRSLKQADAVTAISPFTRSQIHRYLGLPAYLIWNPVKHVTPDKREAGEKPFPYRVLISGRTNDRNKRVRELAIPALIMAGFQEAEVAICGGEYPGWGTNLGVVSDETLNDLLNSVDIVMSTTLNTGLELGPLEAMICGAVPVLCYDMSTYSDTGVLPQHWGCYPSPTALAYRLRTLIDNPPLLDADRQYCLSMSEDLRERFSGRAVAQNILNVYNQLINPPSTT